MRHLLIISTAVLTLTVGHGLTSAQNFLNSDLNGVVTGAGVLPTNWQNVPFTDTNCLASSAGWDSPDLTDISGPSASTGIFGNPYSGLTFVSGMYGGTFGPFPNNFWQEGIMQNVSGFNINQVYVIHFYQSVVKQINGLDESGSWAVYIDTNLAGITTPTYSTAPYNSISFIWEAENITFTATATSHLIKFLPIDDDTNTVFSLSDTNGALRMGIDSIGINIASGIKEEYSSTLVSIFPNPFSTQTILQTDKILKDATLTIYNLYGQTIKQIKNIYGQTLTMQRGNLSSGLYFLQLTQDNKILTADKIIITDK